MLAPPVESACDSASLYGPLRRLHQLMEQALLLFDGGHIEAQPILVPTRISVYDVEPHTSSRRVSSSVRAKANSTRNYSVFGQNKTKLPTPRPRLRLTRFAWHPINIAPEPDEAVYFWDPLAEAAQIKREDVRLWRDCLRPY